MSTLIIKNKLRSPSMFCPLSQAQLLITGLRQLCLYLSVLFFLTPIVNSANEKLTPEVQQRQQEFQQKATAKIRGQVIWPGHDLTHTTVQLYTDEKLQSTYTSVLQLKEGYFEVLVEAGTYFL